MLSLFVKKSNTSDQEPHSVSVNSINTLVSDLDVLEELELSSFLKTPPIGPVRRADI
jgi:hypothetical protein